MLTPLMLRHLWDLIESTQTSILLQFEDSALVQLLFARFVDQQPIDDQAAKTLNSYIKARLPLIRDTAEGRAIQQGTF
ncbi:MAG: hypothetical protein HC780_18360 [Leptolyngbyaceae cyanobacterium CSU_1_3]|nr:hypothetical protein [Leptolyngbyaceae cyanobacterium CSU_1_3]